tara:strand:+ start:2936 stop:4198 length:1263 start_codon:yes stop_codon:yes gene_type:complete
MPQGASLSQAIVATILALSFGAVSAKETLEGDLDPFIHLPSSYHLTPDDLEALFDQGNWSNNPYFDWLTSDRSRAIFKRKNQPSLKVNLSLLGGSVPIEEAIIDFKDGKFLGITISIFNRGDGGSISDEDFRNRTKLVGQHLGKQLAVRPTRREAKPTQGMLTEGYIWISARGKAVLENNPKERSNGKVEFLRMRLAKRDAEGAYEAATQTRSAASVRLSDLPRNVARRSDGSVFIDGIPMVDQGAKGYCAVASAQRLFEYYGIPSDMHQLALIAGSDPNAGTNSMAINRELGSIDHLFKTRFECLAVAGQRGSGLFELKDEKYVGDPITEKKFYQMIQKSVDAGIPLLWGLTVGQFAEDPPLKMQSSGGHMRMIIGYNEAENRLIFSDSWGAGHEFKTMDFSDAYKATHGLFSMKPILR